MNTKKVLALMIAVLMLVCAFPTVIFSQDASGATLEPVYHYKYVYFQRPSGWTDTPRIWAWGTRGDVFSGGWGNRPALTEVDSENHIYCYIDKNDLLREGDSFLFTDGLNGANTSDFKNCLEFDVVYSLTGKTSLEHPAPPAIPQPQNRIWFLNTNGWTKVNLHVWGNGFETKWPGIALTHSHDNIWYYDDVNGEIPAGSNFIFNGTYNGNAVQTGNLSGLELNHIYTVTPGSTNKTSIDIEKPSTFDTAYFFDSPIQTSFGERADLIPAGTEYPIAEGANGLTLLFKIEGLADGESATFSGLDLQFKDDVTGSWISGNSGNWYNYVDSQTFTANGFYALYFPLKWSLNNKENFGTNAALTHVSIFEIYGNYGGNKVKFTTNENHSISLLGVVAGDACPIVRLRGEDEWKIAATTFANGSSVQLKKLDTPSELFGGLDIAPEGQYVSGYTDADGKPVEYIFGQKELIPVISNNAQMQPGVSIRTVTPYGIRFAANLFADDDALRAQWMDENTENGIPKADAQAVGLRVYYGDASALDKPDAVEGKDYVNIPAAYINPETGRYCAVLSGFRADQYQQDLTVVAYLGDTVYTSGTVTRNAKAVAAAVLDGLVYDGTAYPDAVMDMLHAYAGE